MRKLLAASALLSLPLSSAAPAFSQVVLSGRILHPRFPGSADSLYLTTILSFASLDGPGREPLQFRSWELEPSGWYHMSGSAGRYTIAFSNPAHFMRPIVQTNIYTWPGDELDRLVAPQFDCATFDHGAWDEKSASDYYQTFVAKGTSVTQVGFQLVHDGVDGGGPGSQNLLVSIHRKGPGTPDTWEQVGPTMPVFDVDTGGPKMYLSSVGWNSGEVPLVPGETYAVHLRAEQPAGTFQAFWRADDDKQADCYRIGADGEGWQGHDLWMAVSTDSDGLVIPYNKRIHKQFGDFAHGGHKWSQTYVAQGRGLASVIMYAATSGAQPAISRQRCVVRVREGGPDGPVVGIKKVAIGNGNYTGDASWGVFGTAYAPGEVPLTPGETYAIEFESIENYRTLHGFVNIKGQVSNDVAGFTPYRKHTADPYDRGTAYAEGQEAMDYDLDMQIIEYQFSPENWSEAVDAENLLENGDMQSGDLQPDNLDASRADAWTQFAIDPGSSFWYMTEPPGNTNRFVRVIGGSINGRTVDGGYVQRVDGLSRLDTYRVSGRVRCSWPVDVEHVCYVGYDATGQDTDPKADTVVWTPLPGLHGVWVPYVSDPIRPKEGAISVWLRGWTSMTKDKPFEADFDDFALRRVETGVPHSLELQAMSFNIRFGTAADGDNHWNRRKQLVFDVLRDHQPDVVGLQEALRFQLDEILKALPQYGEVGVGRDDGGENGEYSAILYLTERFRVDRQGTFWLSDTPDEPGSKHWGNAVPRICTWVRLVEKHSGKAFYVYNTHLDNGSQPSRELAAELIARRIGERPHPDPVVLTGDLNAGEDNSVLLYLRGDSLQVPAEGVTSARAPALVDTFRALHSDATEAGTLSGFDGRRGGRKIDYVFAPPSATVLEAEIVHDNREGRYPSDHYPVTARMLLPMTVTPTQLLRIPETGA